MYTYILVVNAIVFGLFTFYFQEFLTLKYQKWKRINRLVSINTKNRFLIIYLSFKLLFNLLWLNLIQYMTSNVVKINRNTYEISYSIEGKLYKLITTMKRGPTPILQIISDEEKDVTLQILPYLGTSYNCDIRELSPSFFNYNTLFFEFSDGTNHLFQINEPIKNFLNKIDLLA